MPCSLCVVWVSDYTVPLGQVLHVYACMDVRRQEGCFNVLLEANDHKARQLSFTVLVYSFRSDVRDGVTIAGFPRVQLLRKG